MAIPLSTLLQEAGNTLVDPFPSCLFMASNFPPPSAGRPFLKKLHTESRHVKAQLQNEKRTEDWTGDFSLFSFFFLT